MRRIQVELYGESLEALARVRAAMDAASDAEALRRSLMTLDQIVEMMGDGGRLLVERKNQEVDVILLAGVRT